MMTGRMITRRVLVYIILGAIGFVLVFPFLWMVATSFTSGRAIFRLPPRFDLMFTPQMFDNYVTVLRDYDFILYTINSTVVAGSAALGQIITCSLAAFAFARMRFPGRRILFVLMLSTMMIPLEVTIVPEFLLMMYLGWLDSWAPLIVPSFFIGTFGTLLLKEFFENMPIDLEDAAVVDGATSFTLYRKVYMPLSKAPLATLFIIAFVNNWNELLRPLLYIDTRRLMTLTVALTTFQSEYEARWNLLLTGSVISIIPLLIVYIFMQRYIIEGMTHTGMKG